MIVDPFATTSLQDDQGKSVMICGARMIGACDGCQYCDGTEQASRRQPVKTKCEQLTTCYTGHVRHCRSGCTPDDETVPLQPCEKHCWHYWCHMTDADKGKFCDVEDCKNPFSIERKNAMKRSDKQPQTKAAQIAVAGKRGRKRNQKN